MAQAVAVFCLANALLLLNWGSFDRGAVGCEWLGVGCGVGAGIEVVLLAVLLRGMSPVRFGAGIW